MMAMGSKPAPLEPRRARPSDRQPETRIGESTVDHPKSSSPRASFDSRLARGLSIERDVGHDLFEAGLWVYWPNPPHRIKGAPSFSEASSDLEVLVGTRVIGLEVKSRSEDFADPGDYPYDSVLVGSTRQWAARRDFPWAVVVVSGGPRGGRLVVPTRTKDWWTIVDSEEPSWAAPRRAWKTWDWLLERLKHPTI